MKQTDRILFILLFSLLIFVFVMAFIIFISIPPPIPNHNIIFYNQNHSVEKIDNLYHVNYSTTILYRYKTAHTYSNKTHPLPDVLPVRISLVASPWVNDEECCINLKEVVCKKNVTLHFQKPYNFSCEFNLSGEYGKYMIIVSAGWYHYLEAGKYSRWRWEGLGSTYFDVFLYSMPKSNLEPNPPRPIVTLPEVQGKERAYISRIAFNHPDVQRYVGYGYEVYKVVLVNNSTAMVYFLTKATKPPLVNGITIAVPVDLENKTFKSKVRFYLSLVNISDEQKEKVEKIALSNETVRKIIGNSTNYSVNVSVDYWQECDKRCDFHAYPEVKISLIDSTLVVFVNLGSEKVVRIITE